MAVVLALPRLFDYVVSTFDSLGVTTPNEFGWREPDRKKLTDTRLVWMPGDETGDAGEILPAKQPGRNPRPLATLGELFTVYVEAVEPLTPETERAQYQAVRILYDLWYAVVYRAAHGTFQVVSQTWDKTKKVRQYGARLIVVCSIEAMIPDLDTYEVASTDARAVVVDSELDVDETITNADGFWLLINSSDSLLMDDTGNKVLQG